MYNKPITRMEIVKKYTKTEQITRFNNRSNQKLKVNNQVNNILLLFPIFHKFYGILIYASENLFFSKKLPTDQL